MNDKNKQVNYNFSKGDTYNLSGTFKTGIDKSVSNVNVIDPNIKQALDDLKQTVGTLQKKYPQANEEQATSIIDAEFKEIKRTQPHQWERFLSLKRLWNGLKKGTLKAGEHFAEETPWGKAAIGFLEGVTDNIE